LFGDRGTNSGTGTKDESNWLGRHDVICSVGTQQYGHDACCCVCVKCSIFLEVSSHIYS
jgi:hypothetical protein